MPFEDYAAQYAQMREREYQRRLFLARRMQIQNGLAKIDENINKVKLAVDRPTIEDTVKLCNEFLIGCDPEFVVLKKPKHLVLIGGNAAGDVGWDHNGRVAELRPEPSKNVFTLLRRMRTLIKEHEKLALVRKPDFAWKGAAVVTHEGGTETLGGHVHIDIPFDGDRAEVVVPACDATTRWLEELDIIPPKLCKYRRDMGNYGRFADIRDSAGHLEYRTMPSWLYDPKVALVCLTAIKVAATYPRDTYRRLADKATMPKFINHLGYYSRLDTNAQVAADMLRQAQGCDPEVDFKDVWDNVPSV